MTSLSAYLPLLADASPQFTPGARWSYSNSGFILAGLVIERVSGRRYDEYLTEHVWKPAGMVHGGCYAHARLPRVAAVGYLPDGTPNTSSLPPVGSSAGGCYASAGDLLAFADALDDGRVLSPELVREITTPHASTPGGGYGYGFGLRGGRGGDPLRIWHNGGGPGAGCELHIIPQLGSVVILSNVGPGPMKPVTEVALSALRAP